MGNNNSGAVAIIVETPGLSPIKPNLSASIGNDAALELYQLCLSVTAASLQYANQELKSLGTPQMDIFWAPVENDPSVTTQWNDFPVIPPHTGDQGDKLNHIYSTLLNSYKYGLIIYSDSPHVSPNLYARVCCALAGGEGSKDYLVGPGEYGGFFLFAGRKPIPAAIWKSVPYENQQALNFFVNALTNAGSVSYIEMQIAVDTIKDITRLKQILSQAQNLTPEQMELRSWLNRKIK